MNDELKNHPHSSKRRSLLKWSTPVVAAVVLPSHAQTSPKTVQNSQLHNKNIDYDIV